MSALRHHLLRLLAWTGLLLSPQATADDTLTGGWGGLRKRLADAGLQFQASYTGSAIEHLAGGFRRGFDSQGLLDLSLELDLEKFLGWQGALLHAEGL
jgi:porin